ncbi:MAG: PIN domain nuclease [Pseudomonadota bacterium]
MILVDSSVWIDYFRGNPTRQAEALDALLGVEEIAVGDLILTEVLQGFSHESDFLQAQALLLSCTVVELGGLRIALAAAQNFRTLRAKGITIRKTIDTIIATHCIDHHYRLLHSDRDFDPFVTHLGLQALVP